MQGIMKWLLVGTVVALHSVAAQAASIDVGFERITSNNVENIEDQLSLVIHDQAMALGVWGQNIDADEVLFVFTNNVGIASNIAEIYLDDGTIVAQMNSVLNSLAGFTDFRGGSARPGNLPAGNTVSFAAISSFSADVNPGPPKKGVDVAADALGIVYQLKSGLALADVEAALASGELRVGMHLRSIGTGGGSDSFVNSATLIPEPASAVLSLLALTWVGLAVRKTA